MFDFLLPTWTVYPFMKELCLPKLTLPALLICSIICLPPALISSLNTVYDSVLPTWYLTPEIDICLYDLSCEVIKLQMDLNDTASSLQKTSPQIDPAAFYHFTTEVSAQASILTTHQQQLTRLTLLTEEMINALRDLRQQTPVAQTPSSSTPPTAPTPPTSTTSPRLAFPDKFDGSPTKCKGFLMQCSMFVSQQPMLYPTDDRWVSN